MADFRLKSIGKVIKIKKIEFVVISLLVILITFSNLLKIGNISILFNIFLGAWLVSRPSEWLATAVNNLGRHFDFSEYVIGVITSLMVILGEIVLTIFFFYLAITSNEMILIELAVMTVLYSMTFNFMVLGLIIAYKGGKLIAVPDAVLSKELEIIDWSMAASLLIAFLWISQTFIHDGFSGTYYLPREVAFILPISYLVYTVNVRKVKYTSEPTFISEPKLTVLESTIIVIISSVMVIVGGEFLTDTARILLVSSSNILANFGNPLVLTALLIGAASAIYDAVINLVFASKGQMLASVGNLLASAIQLLMLVIGTIGVIIMIPINRYVAFQLIVISMSLYFYRQAVADKGLDKYEGAMLFLLQLFSLALVVKGF